MSKMVNNYKGKHRGWLGSKAPKIRPPTPEILPVIQMFMNYAVKIRKFVAARHNLRAALAIKGKKALTGKKRQKVLDKYFAVTYGE